MRSIWAYPPEVAGQAGRSLTGFSVEAADGTIGHVDRHVDQAGVQHVVVDTGVWLFGKSFLVPAGVVAEIDPEAETLRITRTKDEIKSAPRFTIDSETEDPAYLTKVGEYYCELLARSQV